MEVHVTSLDERAAALLESGGAWALVANYERSFFLARQPDGALVSIVRHDLPDGPFTARLDPAAPADLRSIAVAPRVSHDGARTWRPQRVPPAEAVEPPELVRRLGALDAIVERVGGGETPTGAALVVPVADRLVLEGALAREDPAGAAGAAARIAGLGPGLTPSGDDLLVGALALHAWAEAAGLGGGRSLRDAIVDAAGPATSRLSGQLLIAAADGHVTAPLAALLGALLRRSGPFPPDVAGVLAIGATSGADLLLGVRTCGRALARQSRCLER